MNKHTFNGILTFLLLLCFFSCKKEEVSIEPTIVEPTFDNRVYTDQILDFQFILKDLINITLEESIKHPELYGLQSTPIADTRDNCPVSTVTTIAGFQNLTIDFDAACDNALPDNTYTGSINLIFSTDIFQTSTGFFSTEVLMSFQNLVINGFSISSLGFIQFEYDATDINYDIFLFTDVVVSKDGITTTYKPTTTFPPAPFGTLAFEDPIGDDDDQTPPAPIAFLNDVFVIDIAAGNQVCCTANDNVTTLCIETTSSLKFQPIACGCIKEGTFVTRNVLGGVCGSINSTYVYDVAEMGPPVGDCDNFVSVNNVVEEFSSNCD